MAFEGDIQKFAPVEIDEVGQLILKARDLLSDPKKWFKGDYVCRRTGAVCIMGALGARDDNNRPAIVEAAIDRIDALIKLDEPNVGVPFFNDRATTKHSDILALLDRAAGARS